MEHNILNNIHIENRKKLFVRFLKENNCYKEFCFYMNINRFKNINKLVDFAETNSANEFSIAFNWQKTVQNFEYWLNLSIKWRKCANNFILNNYK